MVVFSSLRQFLSKLPGSVANNASKRCMSEHRTFPLAPSRWQWNKFKDHVHFYILVGAIPCALIVTYANIFIGPATLTEIPEGYVPKHWEYFKSPVTRFIARYISNVPQQEYEKFLHFIFEEDEKRKLRILEEKIKDKMAERQDYQVYYYRPVMAKYHRVAREAADYLETIRGD